MIKSSRKDGAQVPNTKRDRGEEVTLALFVALEQESQMSQRKLASQMGVALGLTNSYLKRCVRKGWIKVNEAPANRYLYNLTQKGFTEKSRLTTKHLASSLQFYRKARLSCASLFADCQARGWNRILLCGVSDLTEIAMHESGEYGITIVGIYEPNGRGNQLLNKPVWKELSEASEHDACVLTELEHHIEVYKQLVNANGAEKVLAPDILALSPAGSR